MRRSRRGLAGRGGVSRRSAVSSGAVKELLRDVYAATTLMTRRRRWASSTRGRAAASAPGCVGPLAVGHAHDRAVALLVDLLWRSVTRTPPATNSRSPTQHPRIEFVCRELERWDRLSPRDRRNLITLLNGLTDDETLPTGTDLQ